MNNFGQITSSMEVANEQKPLIRNGWIRVLLFVVVYLILLIVTQAAMLRLLTAASGEARQANSWLYISFFISFIVSLLVVWLFTRIIDRKSFNSLGFEWNKFGHHAGTGFFLATALLGSGTLILVAANQLHWTDVQPDAMQLFLSGVLMLLIAFGEEIVFRGYILNNLLQATNRWIALPISALLFAAFHINNPNIELMPVINLFLGRNLWFSMSLHFSWNFFQGPVFGYEVSGINVAHVLEQERMGHALLTGGNFGFEGSVVYSGLAILAIVLLILVYNKKPPNMQHAVAAD
jgi:membrane protease YdiL (CAAX protease family)